LVKYLIRACPSALEAKTGLGDTPLLTACFFGRVDCVQMLVKAGANQTVRNKAGENALHCAVLKFPKVDQLRLLLDQFEPELRQILLTQRTNLNDHRATPLHLWIINLPRDGWGKSTGRPNKKDIEVMKVLLEYGKSSELEMLNGPGDTPLHTAIMLNSTLVVKELLQFQPKLLYRENAVGRTPLELARERFVALRFKAPECIAVLRSLPRHWKMPMAGREERRSRSKLAPEVVIWQMCSSVSRRFPGKRRLVSLNEANDVASRLSNAYSASRYFSVQARDNDEEESKEKEEEDAAVRAKTEKQETAWLLANEKEEKNETAKCGTCGQHHVEYLLDDLLEDNSDESDLSYVSEF
jgi:transcription elongation factor Elf1